MVSGRSAGVPACQATDWAQAWRRTQRPIGTIRPLLSASGMNTSGEISPLTGWCQRRSASTPAMALVARLMIGW